MSTEPAAHLIASSELVAGYLPEVNVLNGCNVHVDQGELVGIIGPNGAGKSTLIKAMFGLVPVRGGQVLLRGEDITGAKAHQLVAKGLGYVPQNDNVFPSLTIEETLQMASWSSRTRTVASRSVTAPTSWTRARTPTPAPASS